MSMRTVAVDAKEGTVYNAMMPDVIIAETLTTFLSIRSNDIGHANDLIPISNTLQHGIKVERWMNGFNLSP